MESMIQFFEQYLTPEYFKMIFKIGALVFLGLPVVYFFSNWFRNYMTEHSSAQKGMIAGKVVKYTGSAIIFIMVLQGFGFELSALLGAAGIMGIAIGFASQTSVSNIISGIFLITEQPFVVNDVIRVGNTTGQVLSIDVLSIKLRTFDNQFVRIPNEAILKSEVTTFTKFPIRRADIMVSVAYKEDLDKVKALLLDIAAQNSKCLQEPAPAVVYDSFGDSGILIKFTFWAVREEWLTVKNEIFTTIKKRFDEEGIEIPFPHLSIYAGAKTTPFPLRQVEHLNGNPDNMEITEASSD